MSTAGSESACPLTPTNGSSTFHQTGNPTELSGPPAPRMPAGSRLKRLLLQTARLFDEDKGGRGSEPRGVNRTLESQGTVTDQAHGHPPRPSVLQTGPRLIGGETIPFQWV